MPRRNDRLHVEITREERDDTIRYNLAVLDQDATKVPDDAWIVPDFEPAAHRDLVRATGYDEWEETVASKRHRVCFLHYRSELEHFGVHVERRDSPRCDDHAAEAFEDRLDSE